MSKRTFIWDAALGCTVEVTPGYVGQRRDEGRRSEEEVYGHCQATDGTDLSTRTRHQRYMRENGLTMASDYTQTWQQKGAELKKVVTPGSGHDSRERRDQIGRTMYELKSRARRR